MSKPAPRIVTEEKSTTVQGGAAMEPAQQIALDPDSKHGSTHINVDVVAKLASLCIREVSGVHALAPFGTAQTLTHMAKNLRGSDPSRDFGVHVEVGTIEAAIDCRIITDYGAKIPEVAKEIRSRLKKRIEPETGLSLKEVNVEVVDLYFPETEKEAPASAPAPAGRQLR